MTYALYGYVLRHDKLYMYICVYTSTCQQIATINIDMFLEYKVTLKFDLSQLF